MNKPRNSVIDQLRGFALIAMVLAHTAVYYAQKATASIMWDLSLFSVPTFIFCSAYLFYTSTSLQSSHYNLSFFRKRILRLLIPYYFFLTAFYGFVHFLEKKPVTLDVLIKNIFLLGGIDFNWLVLLFVFFTFLMPFIYVLGKKDHRLFYLFFAVSLLSSILFLWYKPPFNYRLFMWLPWSLVICATWMFKRIQTNKKRLLFYVGAWGIVFLISYGLQLLFDHSLRMYANKYPPNLYHLAYGIAVTFILYLLAEKGIFQNRFVQWYLLFLSRNSYSFYFVHILVLKAYTFLFDHTKLVWWGFFIIILFVSSVVQYLLDFIKHSFEKSLSTLNVK